MSRAIKLKRPATDAAKEAETSAKKAETAAADATKATALLKAESEKAVEGCKAATQDAQTATTEVRAAGDKAVSACKSATDAALQGAAAAEGAAAQAEQSRQKVEAMAEQIEAAASNIPTGLRVESPDEITLGNTVARYIAATVKPDHVQQNVLYLSDGVACDVEPDGCIVAKRAGISRVHVIPTAGVQYYQTVSVGVVAPRMRMAGDVLRLDSDGNIRLT